MKQPYEYGMWAAVLFNAAIFVMFALGYLKPMKRREWRAMGTFTAFTVALFTEMYGFPLTVFALTSLLGSRYPVLEPFSHNNGNLWATFFSGSKSMSMALMAVGGLMMLAGLVIMGMAWKQVHRANGGLVTTGLYRRVRHPQYSGMFLITVGMLIQWPTIVTLVMWPVLMFMYRRLALREEREMEAGFGMVYKAYMRQTPMFMPRLAGLEGRMP